MVMKSSLPANVTAYIIWVKSCESLKFQELSETYELCLLPESS